MDHVVRPGDKKMLRVMILGVVASGLLLAGNARLVAQDALKLAVGAKGIWDQSISELAQDAGIFRKHGVVLDIFYTQGAGETLQAVISGSADLGIGLGTLGVMGAYAKGAPIRIIGATMTGANDTYLYVPADSPIKSLKDADGRTVAFSTIGSSTHMVVLGLEQQAGVKFKSVAAGSATATLTQVMSGQIDVGWAAAPFGVEAIEQGKIRVIARASDVVAYRTQTSRVLAANLARSSAAGMCLSATCTLTATASTGFIPIRPRLGPMPRGPARPNASPGACATNSCRRRTLTRPIFRDCPNSWPRR
jgi:NitT/TauT family transport system substrate-binding protein